MSYETKDWIEAALLLTHNLSLIRVKRDRACYFEFQEKEKAAIVVEAYWQGNLNVNARDFVDAQRRVKDLIHKEPKNGHGNENRRTYAQP